MIEALEAGRAAAEALMVDTCTITAPGDASGAFDPVTGEWVYGQAVTVYSGPCKVQDNALQPREAEAGEVTVVTTSYRLDLPIATSAGVGEGMTATITSAALDPALVGRRLHIEAPHSASMKTARRFPCEVVS